MDKIEKSLAKLSPQERRQVKRVLADLRAGRKYKLDIKKLKSRDDIFRVRRGAIRIIYRADRAGRIFILSIERRNESTYKF